MKSRSQLLQFYVLLFAIAIMSGCGPNADNTNYNIASGDMSSLPKNT
jgi:hypothetical protein